MHKTKFLSLLLAFAFILFAITIAQADEVVVYAKLERLLVKAIPQYLTGPRMEPVRVYLAIQNLSDRIQTINLRQNYRFWLIKVSECNECTGATPRTDGLPIVAVGNLQSAYGRTNTSIQIQPHSERVEAFGVLPSAITTTNTYRGYILPGKFILRVEIPTGLPGTTTNTTTETIMFYEY